MMALAHTSRRVWPLPALLAWACAWLVHLSLQRFGAQPEISFAAATLIGAAFALRADTRWRRIFVLAGFPLSIAMLGSAGRIPAWAWLLPLAMLLMLYPRKAWRDAPLFPTPAGALRGLALAVPLEPAAKILDAGCGLGAGLVELRAQYPSARLFGIEWSIPLRILCGWRCRDATVRRADMWNTSWADCDLVYLFQRPESLARAIDKAAREMKAGAWLASLEFEASGWRAQQVLAGTDDRPVWLYRMPLQRAPGTAEHPVAGVSCPPKPRR